MFFEGPTPSRFYFLNNYWVVSSDEENVVAALRQKQYSWQRVVLAYLLIPGIIASTGIVIYWFTAKPMAFWGSLVASLAAGLPMFYIQRTERKQLARTPNDTFVLRSNGTVDIQGETHKINSVADLTFEYTYYQSTGAQGDGGYSELDVVILVGAQESRNNLLSVDSSLALHHARKLEQFTGIKLKRISIAR